MFFGVLGCENKSAKLGYNISENKANRFDISVCSDLSLSFEKPIILEEMPARNMCSAK